MCNGGEACTAANRFYVQRGVFEQFSQRLAERMTTIKVDDAVAKGAHVLTGGKRPERTGHFYLPTVLVDVSHDAKVLSEEIFAGRAGGALRHRGRSHSTGQRHRVWPGRLCVHYGSAARPARVGSNRKRHDRPEPRPVSDPAAPIGGVKQSGPGREGPHRGILEFMEAKHIAAAW